MCAKKKYDKPLDDDGGHLHELHRALVVLQRLGQVKHLPAHHRHLPLEQALVEAFILLQFGIEISFVVFIL